LKTTYRRKDASTEYHRQYLPLQPIAFGYRWQQLRCLANMLRTGGYEELEALSILDVGCGTGRLLGDLIGLGGEPRLMCGVDIMEHRLEKAISRYPAVNFLSTDGVTLPFRNESFDLVLQSVVFSSIGLPALQIKLATEMIRVLRPGGFIWWWDMFYTVLEAGNQPLDPRKLFSDLPIRSKKVSWLPRPSEAIAKRRWRCTVGWFVDIFAAKPTHLAALIGPKAT